MPVDASPERYRPGSGKGWRAHERCRAHAHGEFFRDISHASTIVSVTGWSDPYMLVVIEADAYIGV